MDKVSIRQWLLAALLCTALPTSGVLGQSWETVYQADFSADPGWITDQPSNYFWEPAGGVYRATTVNAQPGPSPTRYAYAPIDYDGGSFRLTGEFKTLSIGWSSGVMLGLYDSSLQIFVQSETDPHFVYLELGCVDGGRYVGVNARGLNGAHRNDYRWNLLSDNTWYRYTIEYDQTADSIVATVVRVDNGATVTTLSINDFGGLPADLDRLGFARDPAGECCPGCPGYSCWASTTVLLDNLQLFRRASGHPMVFVANAGQLAAYRLPDWNLVWTASTGIVPVASLGTVPDQNTGVVIVQGQNQVKAYDARTGSHLWDRAGNTMAINRGVTTDVHGQLYACPLSYPFGPPRFNGGAPVVLVSMIGDTSTIALVDSRSGTAQWERVVPARQYGSGFIPNSQGSYDVIISSSVNYTSTGGHLYRVDGQTGQTMIWPQPRQFSNRQGITVPDINGDGEYDLVGAPSNWSSTIHLLSGATGATLWSQNYGSFDVLGGHAIMGPDGCDAILVAQGSSAGGIRRYRTGDGSVVWDGPTSYNNQTMLGLLTRADGGRTVLSGWRHQYRAVAVDAATGQSLWNNVLLYNSDCGAIGIPDVTGDGSEDVLSISNGMLSLYDGVDGVPQTNFSSLPAESAACLVQLQDSPDCNANGIPDDDDIASGFSQDVNANGIPDECELICSDFFDDFEDGSIDANQWTIGGVQRGFMSGNQWQWLHEEVLGVDGYLKMRVWGPTSGMTYGAEAWIQGQYDFNDNHDHVVNLNWEAAVNAWHVDMLAFQITDGTPPNVAVPDGNVFWFGSGSGPTDGPTWKNIYFRYEQPDMPRNDWSILIRGVAKQAVVYSGPNLTGDIVGSNDLPPGQPWFLRFVLADATSAGYPAGDNVFRLFNICSGIPDQREPHLLLRTGTEPEPLCVRTGEPVSVAVQVANLADAINGVQALVHYDPALMTLNPTATVEASGWTRVVLWDNNGDVVYALVYNGGSIGPGDGPFTVATLVFDPIAEGTAQVAFRPDQLPFTTRLTKANDGGVIGGTDLFRTDSGVISIDDTVPTAANTGPVCIGGPVQLLGGPDGMAGYLWVGPNGYTSAEQSPMIDPAVPGEYCLTVANAAGCTYGPVCTMVETFSCITVSLEIPGLAHPVTRAVQFQLEDCEGPGELRTLPVSFAPIGNVGTATILLTDVAPGTDWLSVLEGHTLRTLAAVDLNGGSAQVAVVLRSGDLQAAAIPQDGLVDIVDFSILAARWGLMVSECSEGLPQGCPLGADVTGDGMQDAADLAVMQTYFFQAGDALHHCIMSLQAQLLPQTGISEAVSTGRMIYATGRAVGPRQSISVAELAGKLPGVELADRNGDGIIDLTDVQVFRGENGL